MFITKTQLEAALLQWERAHRDGTTRTPAETATLPAEQVAAEGADTLWALLAGPESSEKPETAQTP